jgi:hypothetical protein
MFNQPVVLRGREAQLHHATIAVEDAELEMLISDSTDRWLCLL